MDESEKSANPKGVTSDEPEGAPQPASTVMGTVSLDHGKRFGQLIGRYKVVRVLGEGGMGTVFLAEQDKPTRLVALKVIRAGVASANLLRRFEHESQVLGRLQHPGIAQIYEAGTADTGEGAQPYFVMEYVRGRSLMEYAQGSQLGTRQRLELLAKICDAVQHAHQKGIIHRDLKPDNILVTEDGQPKILDFGVARATDADIQATTIQTDVGQLVGTIPYMSPEQAGGEVSELDTRSDVYALGVLGYELLAGRLPYDLSKKMIHEAVRVIREDDPTPLSSIDRVFRGDVETIIAKALQKERSQRYQNASDLAGDIRRYLTDRPIVARPASVGYQLRKFTKRNKALVVGVAAVFVVLVGGIVTTSVALARESEQRNLAEQREQQAEVAREEALRQAEIAQTVNDFLTDDLLAAVAPSVEEGKGKDVLMRDVLDVAAKSIEKASIAGGRFEGKPLIEASIRATLGNTYRKLGEYAAAEPHLERARELRHRELGEEHPDTLGSMNSLAVLYGGQGRYNEAEPLYLKTLEIRKSVLGGEHPETLISMSNLALLYINQGRYDEAKPLSVKTQEIRQRVLGEEHPDTLDSMNNLALVFWRQGRYTEAEPLYIKALEIMNRVLGDDHRRTLRPMNNLAALYFDQGRFDKAEPLFIRAIAVMKRVLGEEHPDTLASMINLANLYRNQGRYDKAEPLYIEALEILKHVLGEEHPDTLKCMGNLSGLYITQGRYDEAEPLFLETVELMMRVLGEEHPDTLLTMMNLASLYGELGRYDKAEPLYLKTLQIKKRVLGEEHPETLKSIVNLAGLYSKQGRYEEAEPLYIPTLEIMKRILGEESPDTLAIMGNLAILYLNQGRYAEAEPLHLKALQIKKRVLGEEHPSTLLSINNLAELYRTQARYEKAATLFAQAVAGARKALPTRHWLTGVFLNGYGKTLTALQRYKEADTALLEAHELIFAGLGPDHEYTIDVVEVLADLYTAWHEAEPDKGYDAKAAEWRAKLPEPTEAGEGD